MQLLAGLALHFLPSTFASQAPRPIMPGELSARCILASIYSALRACGVVWCFRSRVVRHAVHLDASGIGHQWAFHFVSLVFSFGIGQCTLDF
jgi:hypothetical protein